MASFACSRDNDLTQNLAYIEVFILSLASCQSSLSIEIAEEERSLSFSKCFFYKGGGISKGSCLGLEETTFAQETTEFAFGFEGGGVGRVGAIERAQLTGKWALRSLSQSFYSYLFSQIYWLALFLCCFLCMNAC